jgi:hypothetical protein
VVPVERDISAILAGCTAAATTTAATVTVGTSAHAFHVHPIAKNAFQFEAPDIRPRPSAMSSTWACHEFPRHKVAGIRADLSQPAGHPCRMIQRVGPMQYRG